MFINIYSPQYCKNPYPIFKYLRQEMKLFRTQSHGYWLIPNYIGVKMILKNSDIFSSEFSAEPSINNPEFFLHSRGLIGSDPPDHTRLRRLVCKAFTPLTVRSFEPLIRNICRKLIKEVTKYESVDIVEMFSMPLPILVIADLMGIDPEKKSEFKLWVELMLTWQRLGKTPDVLIMAKKMLEYFTEVIEERKNNPRNDLISNLVLACENDKVITTQELLATMRLLLIAGSETTTNLISNSIFLLTSHPEIIEEIRSDLNLIDNFIEEMLRYDGPVLSLSRRVNKSVEIAGTKIEKDEIVLALLASANHDESIFVDPENFDMHRNSREQLSFGSGSHYCLGSQLARLQTRIAFEELFRVFKRFEFDMEKTYKYQDSFFFRGIRNLWMITKDTQKVVNF